MPCLLHKVSAPVDIAVTAAVVENVHWIPDFSLYSCSVPSSLPATGMLQNVNKVSKMTSVYKRYMSIVVDSVASALMHNLHR